MVGSYSRKGKPLRKDVEQDKQLVSPIAHLMTSPIQSSYPISSPITTPTKHGSSSSPTRNSLPRSCKKSVISSDFDIQDDIDEYIPSFKKRALSNRRKLPIGDPPIVRLDDDQELNKKFFIESKLKPTWTPPKSHSPKSPLSESISRKLVFASESFDTKMNKQVSPTKPLVKIDKQEVDAWSLFNDDPVHTTKPKLISSFDIPKTPTKKQEPRLFPESQDFKSFGKLYDLLTKTPTKSVESSPRGTPKQAPRQTPRQTPRKTPKILLSPGIKDYSHVRSFKAGTDDVEKEDIVERVNSDKIQDINQLRINGLNSNFNAHLEDLIDDSQNGNISLIRSSLLDTCFKLVTDVEFLLNLQNSGIPEIIVDSSLSSSDAIIQFCFILFCCKLKMNSKLISQLQHAGRQVNDFLIRFQKHDFNDLKLSKICRISFNELLAKSHHTSDIKYHYYMFLNNFVEQIKFDLELIELTTADMDELFINLSLLEQILPQHDEDMISSPLARSLCELAVMDAESELDKSCQILALKSLILVSLSNIDMMLKINPDIAVELFNKIIKDFSTCEKLIQNVILLQLGLILNLIDHQIDCIKDVEIPADFITNFHSDDDHEDRVHILGYTSIVIAHLHKSFAHNLSPLELETLITSLQRFHKLVDKELLIKRIETTLEFLH